MSLKSCFKRQFLILSLHEMKLGETRFFEPFVEMGLRPIGWNFCPIASNLLAEPTGKTAR